MKMTDTQTPQVSIVIVNWNTSRLLQNCLESIYAETKPGFVQTIVVDNASVDDSREMVRTRFPHVELIENTKNLGFAAANNQGIAIAKGDYALLLNSDTIVLDDAISRTVHFADEHPLAAIVGCRVLKPDMTTQPSCFMFPSLLNMLLSSTYLNKFFPHNHFFGREAMTWWDKNDNRQVDAVCGCFMLIWRKTIEEVGMLDERFFMYAEETDLCYRVKQAGWKVLYTPSAQIIHLSGQSSRKVRGEMLIQLRLSILEFIRKHHSWLTHKTACLLTVMFFLFRVPVWLLIYLFCSEEKMQAQVRLLAYFKGIIKVILTSRHLLIKKESA